MAASTSSSRLADDPSGVKVGGCIQLSARREYARAGDAEKAKEMDFAINLIQKIPAGWPRWATLAAIIAAYLFFPDIMKKLRGGQKEKAVLERLMQFLQVKKLLLELEVFQKEKNLSGLISPARHGFWPN